MLCNGWPPVRASGRPAVQGSDTSFTCGREAMRDNIHRNRSTSARQLEQAVASGLEMLERRTLLCSTPQEAFAAQIAGATYHVHELLDTSAMPKKTARAVA